ncbi:MAG: hypothetical protein LKE64_09850 [Solobacterium sp.]|jgi:flavodoxin|nr:hypothetical protein [Solobacterium sp.]MCH4048474.1 hypothetical protein [Solobacterium sp.]MCH4074674.1 hypothetical protein [Solobacterium sp.]MCI1408618.1 hypothetical protein [Solobacterium sp.]MCI1436788.1 hypothetical protein [Solobacterium sp.]
MRHMKLIPALLLGAVLTAGCAPSSENTARESRESTGSADSAESENDMSALPETAVPTEKSAHSLVVWFSLAGEQYAVGNITEGNTAILADLIAEKTGSDTFQIVPTDPYPTSLQELFRTAEQEKDENARPDYQGDVSNWDYYDTVYIGYPTWYDDMPMIVYHFLEDHDFSGKTVCPFNTSGGEGLFSTVDTIREICKGAEVTEGMTVSGTTVQNDRDAADEAVDAWLKGIR